MSLIHMKAMTRGLVLAAVAAAPAFAVATPQQTGQVSATAAPRARTRCVGCDDSTRIKHDNLINKLDSLRTRFTTRGLSSAELQVVGREMEETMDALRVLMETMGAPRGGVLVRSGGAGGAVPAGQSSGFTFVIQNTKKGYIGLSLDGPRLGWPPESEQPEVIRYIQYPRIASVDPSSPAELAGIRIGDTLVAMNGTDIVEHQITLSKILVPDEKVTLKVRRDGDAKEFRLVVAEAPAYIVRRMTPLPETPGAVVQIPAPSAQAAQPSTAVRAPYPGWAPVPSQSVFSFGNVVYGAQLETVSDGLGKALGVKEGVLVIRSLAGTPAFVSGLRDGDVILSAAGTTVPTVRDLVTIVRSNDREDGVKLVVRRDGKQYDIVLRQRQ